jgi:hypothetical protein
LALRVLLRLLGYAFLELFPSLSCSCRKYRLARRSDSGFEKRPRRTNTRSPRAVPWEKALPWASVMIVRTAAADRGRGFVCARAVGARISRGVGTSVTARMPNVCVLCGAGRRHGGKRGGARMTPPGPSTPRPSVRAVSVPHLRPKSQRAPRLQRRVVTQQIFFAHAFVRPAGVP